MIDATSKKKEPRINKFLDLEGQVSAKIFSETKHCLGSDFAQDGVGLWQTGVW